MRNEETSHIGEPPGQESGEQLVAIESVDRDVGISHKSYREKLWKLVRVGGLMLAPTVSIPSVVGYAGNAVDSLRDCPAPVEAEESETSADDIRQKVANMEFGLTHHRYEELSKNLQSSDSIEDIEKVANQSVKDFDLEIIIGELPKARLGIFRFKDPKVSHRPENITVEQMKQAVDGLFVSLSRIPASLIREISGTKIYISNDVGNPDPVGGWHNAAMKAIVLDASDNPGNSFGHELEHALFQSQCGANLRVGSQSAEFIEANPPDFHYGQPEEIKTQYVNDGLVLNNYAGTNAEEDAAEIVEGLFNGLYGDGLQRTPVIHKKSEAIIGRLEVIEPGIREYFRYLAYLNLKDFPGDIARFSLDHPGDAHAECFGVEDLHPAQSVTIDSGLTLHYTKSYGRPKGSDTASPASVMFRYGHSVDEKETNQVSVYEREQKIAGQVARIIETEGPGAVLNLPQEYEAAYSLPPKFADTSTYCGYIVYPTSARQ